MEIDDEDDFYAPDEPETTQVAPAPANPNAPTVQHNEDLEEGEEEDEGAEMDEDDSVGISYQALSLFF
jgi:pre-mRNA 3'-end-processing factor FIP1